MNVTNLIVIAVIAVIIGLAVFKLVRDKKQYPDTPPECAGCPYRTQGNCSAYHR